MRRSTRQRRRRPALAVLLVALVATSCSRDATDGTSAPTVGQLLGPCPRASEIPCVSESAVQSVELVGTNVRLVYSSGRAADRGSWGGWVLDVQRYLDVGANVLIGADGRRYDVEAMPRRRGEVRTLLVADEDAQLVDEFDSAGRLVATRDALTGGAIAALKYTDNGRLRRVDSANDSPITLSYDGAGHLSRIEAGGLANDVTTDADGRIVGLAARDGSRWRFGYEHGRLVDVAQPTGATTQFAYGKDGALASIAGPSGQMLSYERQEADDRRTLRIESSSGAAWSVEERVDGETTTRRFEEAGAGAVVEVAKKSHRHVERADGSVVDVDLSPDPRFGASAPVRTRATRTLPSGATVVSGATRKATLTDSADPLAVKRLDAKSTGVETLTWTYDGASKVVTEMSAEGRTSSWTLDEVGRAVLSTTPGGPDIATTYDAVGRAAAVENGDAKWTQTIDPQTGSIAVTGPSSSSTASFDEHGRVVSFAHGDEVETIQAFDSAGSLVEVRPGGAGAHVLARDGEGRISATATPAVPGNPIVDVSYERDVDGNIVRVSRGGNDVMTIGRDQAGAIDTVDGAYLSIVAQRDPAGLLERLSVSGGATVELERDGDRLTSETWSGPIAGVVRYDYDNDRVSEMTVGDIETAIKRDRDGVLIGVGPITRKIDPATGLATATTIGDVTVTMGYDDNGRTTAVDVAGPDGALASRRIRRDALGRVAETNEVVGEATSTAGFGYDAAGRLAGTSGVAAAAGATTVGPDGDLATIAGQPSTIDVAGRLTAVGPTKLGYDSAGRVTTMNGSDGVTTYEWDGLGRLAGVRLPDGRRVTYLIDGDGRRIARDVDGKRTTGWLYSGSLRPVAELDANGSVRDVLLHDDDDKVVGILRDGQGLTVVSDQIGSPWLIVDAGGTVVDHIVRDAAGRIVSETAPGTTTIGFAGGIADPLTGLVHFGAREYSPRLQRWLSPDPIGFASSDANLYRYADGDPVNKRDLAGLDSSVGGTGPPDPPRSDAGRILDQVDRNGKSASASSIEKSFTPPAAPGGPDRSSGRRGSGTVNGTPGGKRDPNVESGDYRVPRPPGPNGGTGDHDRGDVSRPASGDSPGAPEDGGGAAGANGDTHLYTLTRRMYDLQLTGEYVAARDSKPGFEVQIRQVPVTGSTTVATVGAVALDVDGTHVVIHAREHDPLLIDGERTAVDTGEVKLSGGGTVRHTAGRWQVDWPDGSRVDVRGDRRLNVQVRPSQTRAGRIDGLIGASDGTLRTATGDTIEATPWPPSFETVHRTFAPTWRLTPERSLFTYEPGETTDGFHDPAFPSGPTDLTTIDPIKVAAARRLCATLGDRGHPAAVDACVLDVAATGDPSFVTDAQMSGITSPAIKDVGSKGSSSKDRSARGGAGDDTADRGAEKAVADGTLVTGSIDKAGDRARFVVDVPDGLGFALVETKMSCDLTLNVEDDSGTALYGSPLCTGNIDHFRPNPKSRLKAGRYHLTVRGEGDATGPFTFRYIAAKPKKFTVELGKEVTPNSKSGIGTLGARGEVHLLRFDADGAAAVKLTGTAEDSAACGDVRVVVYNLATGDSVLRAPDPCDHTTTATLPDPKGSYLAVVDSPTWTSGTYSFRLERASTG